MCGMKGQTVCGMKGAGCVWDEGAGCVLTCNMFLWLSNRIRNSVSDVCVCVCVHYSN